MQKIFNKKTWITWALILILAPIFIYGQIGSESNYAAAYDFKTDSGLYTTADQAGFETNVDGDVLIDSLIAKIILIILTWVGVLFFVLIVFGGFSWMIAEGNQDKIKKAKGVLLNAIVGLIITLAAYAITSFIVERLN